jgi:hypothetical protein
MCRTPDLSAKPVVSDAVRVIRLRGRFSALLRWAADGGNPLSGYLRGADAPRCFFAAAARVVRLSFPAECSARLLRQIVAAVTLPLNAVADCGIPQPPAFSC